MTSYMFYSFPCSFPLQITITTLLFAELHSAKGKEEGGGGGGGKGPILGSNALFPGQGVQRQCGSCCNMCCGVDAAEVPGKQEKLSSNTHH